MHPVYNLAGNNLQLALIDVVEVVICLKTLLAVIAMSAVSCGVLILSVLRSVGEIVFRVPNLATGPVLMSEIVKCHAEHRATGCPAMNVVRGYLSVDIAALLCATKYVPQVNFVRYVGQRREERQK